MALTYIFMGAPGAGKDAQAESLATSIGGTYLSSGNELRRASRQDPLVRELMDAGGLVPEYEFMRIMGLALANISEDKHLVLSGVTKRPGEVDWLVNELAAHNRTITAVIVLEVSPTVGSSRIAGRTQNRSDDQAEKQVRRRREFDTVTTASIERYRTIAPVLTVNADGTLDEVSGAVMDALATLGR